MMPICQHFIHGRTESEPVDDGMDVVNPATGEALAVLPLAGAADVERAVSSASDAFRVWSETPAVERARVLFRFRRQIEEHRDELVRLVVLDNGKTWAEAQGDVQRGLESVEYATGMPAHLLGTVAEDVSAGVDCEMFRQPLGVVAGFTPFNFPVMVPLWMIPVAVACGNTFILKPSERAPMASVRLAELFAQCGAPPGVFNVLHGGGAVAEALIDHPRVAAVSVVGSTPIARQVYAAGATRGKRVQALGGAKNTLIVMPDCRLPWSVDSITSSAFGCAGQRCLAGSNVIAVGEVAEPLIEALAAAAARLRLGPGIDPETGMGPVIAPQSRERVLTYIDAAVSDGARLALDGRGQGVADLPRGNFVGPTIVDGVECEMAVAREEVFGPVLSVQRARDLSQAIEMINTSPYGNSASIYTTSGGAAREFRRRVEAGMLGVNLGVPAPMPFFPFSGWKASFFGDLHAQGKDAIDFYTRRKVVSSRWP
jgi:malonate-semialdehyde dehydrogenase (acetylating)/methylmalonate-semialdehyde dehydrogenase